MARRGRLGAVRALITPPSEERVVCGAVTVLAGIKGREGEPETLLTLPPVWAPDACLIEVSILRKELNLDRFEGLLFRDIPREEPEPLTI